MPREQPRRSYHRLFPITKSISHKDLSKDQATPKGFVHFRDVSDCMKYTLVGSQKEDTTWAFVEVFVLVRDVSLC